MDMTEFEKIRWLRIRTSYECKYFQDPSMHGPRYMQRYQSVHERVLYNCSCNDLFMRMMSEAVNDNRAF